jgi:hypothetical protein
MGDTWAVEIEGWRWARGVLVLRLAVCSGIQEISGNLGPDSEWRDKFIIVGHKFL